MSASRTNKAASPRFNAAFAAIASDEPRPRSGSGFTSAVQPLAKLTPSGPVTIIPCPNPASSTASIAHRPSGLPAHTVSSLPPPKRVPSPAASTATGGSAMRVKTLVGSDDLGQHRDRQHAGLAAARDDADRRADATELVGGDARRR